MKESAILSLFQFVLNNKLKKPKNLVKSRLLGFLRLAPPTGIEPVTNP